MQGSALVETYSTWILQATSFYPWMTTSTKINVCLELYDAGYPNQ